MAYVGRPTKIETVEQLDNAIEEYFTDCEENNKPLTMSGLARCIGIDRTTLVNYGKGQGVKDEYKKEFIKSIKRAKEKVQEYAEECLFDKDRRNMTGVVFALKNNYAWKDQQDIEVKGDLEYKIKLPEALIETHAQSTLIEAESEAVDEE